RVGVEAARLAGVPRVFESTMNREYLRRVFAELPNVGDDQPRADEFDDSFGSPESVITHAIDVTDFLERKRAAMAAHASQIPPDSFFLTIPPDAFRLGFGVEWYIERNATRRDGAPFRTDLLG
ncbi:MAG TPA: GlcNAc-PI de-N-acetylase, partial [Acidimicrobiales bacterium]